MFTDDPGMQDLLHQAMRPIVCGLAADVARLNGPNQVLQLRVESWLE